MERLLSSKTHIFCQSCERFPQHFCSQRSHTVNTRDDGYSGGLAVTGAFCGRTVTFLLQNELPKPTYNAGIYNPQNRLNAGNPARTAIETCLLQAKVYKVNLFCSVFQSSTSIQSNSTEFSSGALALQQSNKDHNQAFYAAKIFLTWFC